MHSKSFYHSLSSRQSNGDILSQSQKKKKQLVPISHLVVKWVLGAATYHMTECCSLTGPGTSVVDQTLPSGSGLAHKTRMVLKSSFQTLLFTLLN